MFEPTASKSPCGDAAYLSLTQQEAAELEQSLSRFHISSAKEPPTVSERIDETQQAVLRGVPGEGVKNLIASLLSAPKEQDCCQELEEMLDGLDEVSKRTSFVQQTALPICDENEGRPSAISISDEAIRAEVQELLAALAPPTPPKKDLALRSAIFGGRLPKAFIETPPVGHNGRETRCLIVYLVALGLGELHKRQLCHMNVKAKHVEVGRDSVTGGFLGRLVDDGSVVKIGDLFKHCTFEYVDQDIISSPENIIAHPAHDMWALGLFFYDLIHGQAANPLHQLKAHFTKEEWSSAVERLRATLCPSDHIDKLISQLLCPAQERLSAQRALEEIGQYLGENRCGELVSDTEKQQVLQRIVCHRPEASLAPQAQCPLTPEMARTVPFLEETLFLAPKDEHQRQERLAIAYHLAKDYASQAPYFEAKITPQSIELFQHPVTGKITGIKFLCRTQRKEPLVDQLHSPDPNKFSFGLILFSMLFGKTSVGVEVDFTHLPDPETAEWDQILQNIRKHLGQHRVDITIDLLLTRPDFSVQSSVGILERLLKPAAI
jgi:hypothetical protein